MNTYITIPTPDQHLIQIPEWIRDPTSETLPPIDALKLTRIDAKCGSEYDSEVVERSFMPFTWPTGTVWFRPIVSLTLN